ncbi:MAG: cupredoxin domain-containing protein [bacterium]|nr:cupredoxin domain-containing protein [bacterium]
MKKFSVPVSIIVSAIIVAGSIYFSANSFGGGSDTVAKPTTAVNNISTEGGKQIIDIMAKGGYSPRQTVAKAGVPTVLRIKTNGTFDCTSSLSIAALNYKENLPPTGVTEIEVPPQKAGAKLTGLCSMGMYNFSVNFN